MEVDRNEISRDNRRISVQLQQQADRVQMCPDQVIDGTDQGSIIFDE